MNKLIKILIVEDNPGDTYLCKELLLEIGLSSQYIEEVSSLLEFENQVKGTCFDVVLLDLFLPDSHGRATFDAVKKLTPNAAIIVLSGLTDYDVSVYAVQSGAQDFLVKGAFDASLLEKTIVYSLERVKHMKILESTQRQYRDLFMKNPLPTLIIGVQSKKVFTINHAAIEYFGMDEAKLLNSSIDDLMELPFDELSMLENSEERDFLCQQNIHSKAFSIAKVYFRKIELDGVFHWLLLLEDVTEKIRFEHEKKQLTSKVQDFERKKIAMELHDGIAQELTLLSLYLNQLENSCTDQSKLEMCKRLISDTITQTRALTYSINPPLLDEGLESGLRAFFSRLSRLEYIHFPFELTGNYPLDFDYDTSYNIFRIMQEFINNSVKHSDSKVIGCRIESKKDSAVFRLYDKGNGFDFDKSQNVGMGLKNIHERSMAMGFRMVYKSEKEQGTTMDLIIERKNMMNIES